MLAGILGFWNKGASWAAKKSGVEPMAAIEAAAKGLVIRFKSAGTKGFTRCMLWSSQGEKGGMTFQEICGRIATMEGPVVFEVYIQSNSEYAPNASLKGVYTIEEWTDKLLNQATEEDVEVPDILKQFIAPQRQASTATTGQVDGTAGKVDLAAAMALLHKR